MPLKDHLTPDCIRFLSGSSKAEAIGELTELLVERKGIGDREEFAKAIWHREELMSTGIGLGIAVPHVRLEGIERPLVAIGIRREGITDYESLDGKPVRIIVMIAAGRGQHAAYIQLLAEITRILKRDDVRGRILRSESADDVQALLAG